MLIFDKQKAKKCFEFSGKSSMDSASHLGVHLNTLYNWLNPKKDQKPDIDQLQKLADFWGCDLDDMRTKIRGAAAKP